MHTFSFTRSLFLRSAAIALLAFGPVAPAAAAERIHVAQAGADEMAWGLVRDSADPAVLERFIAQFPDSPYVAQAQEKLRALDDQGGSLAAPVPPPEAPEPKPPAEPSSYALDVQRELKRVGCYPGKLDGDWGAGSRRALAGFASASGSNVGSQPTADVLTIVRSKTGTVCAATKKAEKPGAGGGSSSGGGGAGCYNVSLVVDREHPEGGNWDPWSGGSAPPDPVIRELTTGARAACDQSYTCSLQVNATSGTLSFHIVDDDIDADDLIGQGQCRAGSSCRLGYASLSMSRC